jgi:site-specific DNA-methyltransferase (adenine-specific)
LKFKNDKSIIGWDVVPSSEYFSELFRVSKNQIIWGGNYFNLPPYRCPIIWDKLQPVPNFSAIELAWSSFDQPSKIFKQRQAGFISEKKIHPTQKPTKLYKWLLSNYAKPGDRILDTHLGSGSSRIAAYDMGFEFWGYEIDKAYFDMQEKRFLQFRSQHSLEFT